MPPKSKVAQPIPKPWEIDPEVLAWHNAPFRLCPHGVLHCYVGWVQQGHTTRQHTPGGKDGEWGPPCVRNAGWMRETTDAGVLAAGLEVPV